MVQTNESKLSQFTPQFKNSCKGIHFESCYILELIDRTLSHKKYVKIMGIVTEIKKKLKYIELRIDDSSYSLRAIFWASKCEYQESKLTRNFYTNPPELGTLVESRGVIELYKNKIQLKLFSLNIVADCNEESLWWFNLYQKKMFIKQEFRNILSIKTKADEKLVISFTPIRKRPYLLDQIQNLAPLEKSKEFVCICKKCHSNNIFYNSTHESNQFFRMISRMVASSFVYFISTYQMENDPEEEFMHFSVNYMLISNTRISSLLKKIPIKCIPCIFDSAKKIFLEEYGYKNFPIPNSYLCDK